MDTEKRVRLKWWFNVEVDVSSLSFLSLLFSNDFVTDGAVTLGLMTLCIKTVSIIVLIATRSEKDIQHNDNQCRVLLW